MTLDQVGLTPIDARKVLRIADVLGYLLLQLDPFKFWYFKTGLCNAYGLRCSFRGISQLAYIKEL